MIMNSIIIEIVVSVSCLSIRQPVCACRRNVSRELLVLQIHTEALPSAEISPPNVVKAWSTVTTPKNDASHTIQMAQIDAREMMQVKYYLNYACRALSVF
jgi:hypothetical protein